MISCILCICRCFDLFFFSTQYVTGHPKKKRDTKRIYPIRWRQQVPITSGRRPAARIYPDTYGEGAKGGILGDMDMDKDTRNEEPLNRALIMEKRKKKKKEGN